MLILTIDGTRYTGWTDVAIARGIDRAAASFAIGLTDPWQGQKDQEGAAAEPWAVLAGSEVTLAVSGAVSGAVASGDGGDAGQAETVITGFVDTIEADLDEQRRRLRISGRSRTGDLVDCAAEVEGGRFSDQTLDQMARLLAEPFGIDVLVETDMGAAFPAVQIETGETVHALLTRLARHRAVLVTDTPDGGLRLTRPGAGRAADDLVQGVNLVRAQASLSLAERYSPVTVRGQRAGGGQADLMAEAVHEDKAIDRYRPLIVLADEQVSSQDCGVRAESEIRRRAGKGTLVTVTVAGWHMSDGSLWRAGDLVSVKAPALGLARDLVVGNATFRLTEGTHLTDLQVAPVEAFVPDGDGSDQDGDGGDGAQAASDSAATADNDENADYLQTLDQVRISLGRDPIE